MAGTLYLTQFLEMEDQGTTLFAKAGATGNGRLVPESLSVTGEVLKAVDNSLADATGVNIWTGSNPDTFNVLWVWTSVAMDVQLFGDSLNVALRTRAEWPLVLATDDLTLANNTTELSSDPTTENIDKVRLWNSSGSAGAYVCYLIL